MIPLQSATSQTGKWVADSGGGRRGHSLGVMGEGGELGAGGGELGGKEQRVARGPPLGVLRDLEEVLGIKNFRRFTKAATVKIELENSVTVERANLGLDFLVTHLTLRPSCVAEKDHLFGFEVL